MNHAAFMPDHDLCTLAASGDAPARLTLIERHAADLLTTATHLTAEPHQALVATATLFTELFAGQLPTLHTSTDLQAALPAILATIPAKDLPALPTATTPSAAVLAAVLQHLPANQRAALLAQSQPPEPPAAPPVTPLPDPIAANPPPVRPAAQPAVEAALRWAAVAAQQQPRRRDLRQYLDRPTAARWLVPLAILAVCVAVWVSQMPLITPPVAPDPLPSVWPTLRPRPSQVVAQVAPTVTVPPAPTVPAVTNTAPPPSATATPSAPAAPIASEPAPTTVPPVAAVVPTAPPAAPALPPVPTVPPPVPTAPPPAPPARAVPIVSPTATATAAASPTTAPTTAQLVLNTQSLGFGVEVGPRTVTFTNAGNDPLTWRVSADSTWVEIAQGAGTLAPGASQSVGLTVARADLPTGAYTGAVQVQSNGGDGLVAVTMAVSPSNTTVSAFAEPATPLGAWGCAEPTTYLVSATIAGKQAPKKAVVYYAVNGGTQQTKDLTTTDQQRYSAPLGPFAEPGSVVYSLVITEADGNIVRSAPYTLTVTDCASRIRTVPVVPPMTEPFILQPSGHNRYTFAVTKPGTLVVTLVWQNATTRLSTLLYSPRWPDQPIQQRSDVGNLTFTFPVTAADIAAGGNWALHLVNYEQATATGRLELNFVPEGQTVPMPSPQATPTPQASPSSSPAPATPVAPPPATPTPTIPAPSAPPTPTPTTPPSTPTTAPPLVRPAVGGTPTR